jgi:peroxiredoxin
MVTVRSDVFKIGDTFATLLGDEVNVGDTAPAFTSVVPGWGRVNPLEESKGKVIILSAVPSLDTDVCDRETRRFNEEAAKLSEDIIIYTISCDFPMAQKRWCGAAGVDKVKVVSDVVDAEFGVKRWQWATAFRRSKRAGKKSSACNRAIPILKLRKR